MKKKKEKGLPITIVAVPLSTQVQLALTEPLAIGLGQIPLSPAPLSKGTAKEQTKSDMESKAIPEMTKSGAEMTKSASEMTKSGAEMT